jgi:hypothetical protein
LTDAARLWAWRNCIQAIPCPENFVNSTIWVPVQRWVLLQKKNPRHCLADLQLLDDLNPPTKVLEKFLKTWGGRETTKQRYFGDGPTKSSDWKDPATITLTLSRMLITVVKAKNVLNIEAGLEMIALAMAISSEVCSN